MRKIIVLSMLLLGGCANMGMIQADCEQNTTGFANMVACLHNAPQKNTSEVKLYLLQADYLAQKVQQGTMSELDAKLELQKMYVELEHAENARKSAAIAAYGAIKPRSTNCYPVGNTVQCNSY